MKIKNTNGLFLLGSSHEISEFKDSNNAPQSLQLLKVGKFFHPQLGKFKITENDLKEFVQNFKAKVHPTDVAINLDHEKTDAAGWFKSLDIRNSGSELWATLEWTELGVEKVGTKQYRYVSAEVSFKYRDNESGKITSNVLTGAALTNYPFIKGMKEVVGFSENLLTYELKENSKMDKAQLIAALLAIGIDFNEIEDKAGRYDQLSVDFSDVKKKVESGSKLLNDATKKLEESETKVKELETTVSEQKFSDLVTKGMKEGKLTKAESEGSFKELYESMGHEFAEKHLGERAKVVDISDSKGHGKEKKVAADGEAVFAEIEKLAKDEKINFSEACDMYREKNPESWDIYEKEAKDSGE